MIRIIKYALLITLLVATSIFLIEEYPLVGILWQATGSAYYILILGFIAMYILFLRKRLAFLENLQHEVTHLLFAVLTFRRITGLYVSATCGSVDTGGTRKSSLITLSPYFFPLLSVLFICVFSYIDFQYSRQLVIVSYTWYLVVLVGNFFRKGGEIYSSGILGILPIIILNFWVGHFILSWCMTIDFGITTILKTIYYGIT